MLDTQGSRREVVRRVFGEFPGRSPYSPLLALHRGQGTREGHCCRDSAAARMQACHPHPPNLAWSAPMISSAAPNVDDRVDAGITDGAAGSQHRGDPTASGSRRSSTVDHSRDRRPFAIRVAGVHLPAAASPEPLGSRHGRHSPQAHHCSKRQKSHERKKRLSQGACAASAQLTRSPQATRAGLASQRRSHRRACRRLQGPAARPALEHVAEASPCRAQPRVHTMRHLAFRCYKSHWHLDGNAITI